MAGGGSNTVRARFMSTHPIEREARDELARLCAALLAWVRVERWPGASESRSDRQRQALEDLRSAARQAGECGTPGHPCHALVEVFAGLPVEERPSARGVGLGLARSQAAARAAALALESAGSLRDGASLAIMAELLGRHAEGRHVLPELHGLVERWRANPDRCAPSLGEPPCLAPGGLVALDAERIRCMGDTSFTIDVLDPPSGVRIFSLYDVPVEGVAFSLDGRHVHAQSWSILKGERIYEAYETLTGASLRRVPVPGSPGDVVMLTELFTATFGEGARSTPLQIRLENAPPRGHPPFLFGAE